MPDETAKPGKTDGQSIPALLAASPDTIAASKVAKAIKAAARKSVEQPAAVKPVIAVAASSVTVAPASAAKGEPSIAAAKPEPIAPVAIATSVPTMPTVASAPAVHTPPAAVPADIQKECQMATTIENAAQTTTDKAQALFTETSERAKGAMAKSAKLFEDANAFGKGNVEALVESSKIAAKGFETLGQDAAEFTRKSFEDATAAFKTLASVKSPTEFMKLQSDYVRSAFDALVAETSRSTEQVLKLAGEVAQPISNRVAVAADKLKVAA